VDRSVDCIINLVAFVANLGMLICLLMYKQAAKKTINIFVCNQTVLDLVFSFTGIVKFALQISGYHEQTKTGVLRTFMKCLAQMAYVAYLSLLSRYM